MSRNVRLAAKVQQGDRRAFEKLYRLNFEWVYYVSLKMLGSDEEALEVTQDVFETVLEKVGTLKNPGAFPKWIKQIVYNTCASRLRAKKQKKHHISGNTMNEKEQSFIEENKEFLPEVYFESQEGRDTIAHLVEKLPDAQKEAVLLFYYEDLSGPEIADITNTNLSTIHRRLGDARVTLRRQLGVAQTWQAARLSAAATPILGKILKQEALKATTTPSVKIAQKALLQQLSVLSITPSAPASIAKVSKTAFTKGVASITTVALVGVAGYLIVQEQSSVITDSPESVKEASISDPAKPLVDSFREEAPETPSPESSPLEPAEFPRLPVQEESVPAAPVIVVGAGQYELVYPAGAVISAQQIIEDTRAYAKDGYGEDVTISLMLYELVDFMQPGSYIVGLSACDSSGRRAETVPIILRVE